MIILGAVIAALLSGPATATDGDTLKMGTVSVRLFGIDAPEAQQRCSARSGNEYECGTRARLFLAGAVYGRSITCEPKDIDRFGRTVAICSAGGVDLGRALVSSGLAVAYREYTDIYVEDERVAKQARRGLWAGRFDPPSSYRANRFR